MPPLYGDPASMDLASSTLDHSIHHEAALPLFFASVAIVAITVLMVAGAPGEDPPRQRTNGGSESTADGLDTAIKHLDAFTTGTRKYGKPWKQLDPAILADDVLWLEFGHYIVNRTDLKVSAARGRSNSVVSEHRELIVSGYCE